ncbi:molybdopterin adenylyltransferase [Chloroflexota bacterium]
MLKVAILTISDKGSQGFRVDKSGEVIRDTIRQLDSSVVDYDMVPDDKETIAAKLAEWADRGEIDLILTTGGTGLSERDVTPEATIAVVEKVVPGLAETMRSKSLEKTPMAMLSRATAGMRKKCLIVNLPGSPKAVKECLEVIIPALPHAIEIITGEVTEHETPKAGGI